MLNAERPLITLAIVAYNQERYIRAAVRAAFAQSYTPLEILLSDDCSSDGTFRIMQELAAAYSGPHRVVVNRNSENLNIGSHFNVVGTLSAGKLIVFAAGDDVSNPERVQVLFDAWDRAGRGPAVLCSDFRAVGADGQATPLYGEKAFTGPFLPLNMARGRVGVLGATSAASREIFDAFPPISSTVRHEDRVLAFRAVLLGGSVHFVPKELVAYRVDGGVSRAHHRSVRERVEALAKRTLADALQRCEDVKAFRPHERHLVKACEKTVELTRALIEISGAEGMRLELALVKCMFRGALAVPLLKQYARLRFRPFMDAYYSRATLSDN